MLYLRLFTRSVCLFSLATLTSASLALAGPDGLSDLGFDVRGDRASVERSDSARRERRADEISRRMGLSRAEVSQVFSELKATGQLKSDTVEAWKILLKSTSAEGLRNPTPEDLKNADLAAQMVGALIHLRKNAAPGEGLKSFTEVDLVTVERTWSHQQKANFAETLRTAADISKKNPTLNAEQAFEKALKKLGYYEKFKQSCAG